MLSQYQANLRVGHLEDLYHVFVYMKSHLDIGCVAFDPKTLMVDESAFNNGVKLLERRVLWLKRFKRNCHLRCQSHGDKG